MGNFDFGRSGSKIYRITSSAAYGYAAILLLLYIFKETFFVDGTWFHGFLSMIFSIFSSVFMIGILFVFSKFIDTALKHRNATLFIYTYIFFIFLTAAAVLPVLVSGIKVYHSLQTDENAGALMRFGDTSTSSAILMVVARIGSFITGIMLGFQLRNIRFGAKSLFQILGVLFIVFKLISAVEGVNLIRSEILSGLLNVGIVALIAYILSQRVIAHENEVSPTATEWLYQKKDDLDTQSYGNPTTYEPTVETTAPTTPIEPSPTEPDAAPVDHSAHRDEAIKYYDDLIEVEKTRLHYIITKNNPGLSENEVYERVIQYISEKRLFDSGRFAP